MYKKHDWVLNIIIYLRNGTRRTTDTLVQIESLWTKKETSHDCWFLIMEEHISLMGYEIPIEAQIFASTKEE